jgi:hypothetical protein
MTETSATKRGQPSARLYAIVARAARRAVVFRRGPSKSVLALTWNLQDDTLEAGQWFKGRIYERRCDLSPDGELLVYFAGYRGEFRTWTAISRPPYLTALALWPKGDAWGGGGLFADSHSLRLNHWETTLAIGFSVPTEFRVELLGERSGWGEDDPINFMRLERDGWRLASEGGKGSDPRFSFPIDSPQVLEKSIKGKGGATLRVSLHGIHERDGTWYVETSQVAAASGEVVADLGRTDWADLDYNGDVLYASQGRLYRLRKRKRQAAAWSEPILVADLNSLHFQPVAPPARALSWPKSARSGRP